MSTTTSEGEQTSTDSVFTSHQHIAHDLRSPLSALNFISSLNPDLPEASRELLDMAIKRLQEIADKLDSQ